MLGPLTVVADGTVLELPASRKTRSLFAYLALSGEAVGRSRLCELLWERPSDPRGELRWCLSKIRVLLGQAGRGAVETSGESVRLHLDDCAVDALDIAAAGTGIDRLDADRLRATIRLFAGDFLEGLEVDRSPQFSSWLATQRRRFRGLHATFLEELTQRLAADSGERTACLERWVELAPTDTRANAMLLTALLKTGKAAEAERHLDAAARLFEGAALDFGPVRTAWRLARTAPTPVTRHAQVASPMPLEAMRVCTGRDAQTTRRASLAVMPLFEDAETRLRGGLADGLADDIITRLAKLRSIFVIARGSVFALAERRIGADEAGRMLGVDYVVSGTVRRRAGRILISIELSEGQTARIVWTEVFDCRLDAAFETFDQIGNGIVASISSEVEAVERNRAMLKPPESLNAWEAYHRGLWHMYRFTQTENERARHFFQTAVALDPTFAGGHAGLSFTHWQSAFQHWGDRDRESDLAIGAAGMSLLVDEHSPAAHWAMGRALWLRGLQDQALRALEKAVELSPNFALGHYTLAFVHSQSGDPEIAIRSSDLSRRLSPFDPLLFAMLASKAVSLVRLRRFEEASEWALQGAARPNAHNVIRATAAHCLAFLGRIEEARSFVALIRQSAPDYSVDDYLTSFRFKPDDAALFRESGKRIGLG